MIKAVVVSSNHRQAAAHAEALLMAGYAVELCGGPQQDSCPVLGNLPCPLVDRADVLIYDAHVVGGDGGRELITEVRETYPDLPIVLTSADKGLAWVETEGPHRVTPLAGSASPTDLLAAIDSALSEQGMAV
jgi:hypothetical protein